MERRHLTDEEIQDYLDGDSLKIQLKSHLETCKICQNNIKQYQSLYAELKTDPGFQLPKNFAVSVVSKLPVPQSTFPFAEIVLFLTGSFLALGTMIYFVDWKLFAETISRMTIMSMDFKTLFLAPIKNLLSGLNGNLYLLLFAGLVLLTIAAIDHIILRLKYRSHVP